MDKIHLKSPKGWINDPNGFIYYKGKYHLFYQHFPYAPKWGRMHWGHAVSDDLTDWEHVDIALFPTKTNDMDGCFSGSAVECDGTMHLFYTGVRYEEYDPENVNCNINDKFVSSQMTITSEDGFHFDNFKDKHTIIPPFKNCDYGHRIHTRDPKVWCGLNGNWYMVLGSTVDNKGRLLFYKSSDLKNWTYMNFAELENFGWMWECPDYFETDGQGVLIFSPMGIEKGSQSVCTLANFDEGRCSMDINPNWQYFDYGLDLYAPQSTVDRDGRRTVIAWLRMPEKLADNTIGMYCIPRICEVKNGHIYFRPHPDVRSKFTRQIASPKEAEGAYLICAGLEEGESMNIGGFVIGRKDGRIYTDRSAVAGSFEVHAYSETPKLSGGFDIEVYVEENIIEVYVGGGEYVITNAVYGLTDEIKGTIQSGVKIYATEEYDVEGKVRSKKER